jgi:hypothetical protein
MVHLMGTGPPPITEAEYLNAGSFTQTRRPEAAPERDCAPFATSFHTDNQLVAEQMYGRKFMERLRRERKEASSQRSLF